MSPIFKLSPWAAGSKKTQINEKKVVKKRQINDNRVCVCVCVCLSVLVCGDSMLDARFSKCKLPDSSGLWEPGSVI